MENPWVFFYGSYMDIDALANFQVRPTSIKVAKLNGWEITFGPLAMLIPSKGNQVYGTAARLSGGDLERLYSREQLKDYKTIDVRIQTTDNQWILAKCYVCEPDRALKPSPEYLRGVIRAAEKLELPESYREKLKSFLDE